MLLAPFPWWVWVLALLALIPTFVLCTSTDLKVIPLGNVRKITLRYITVNHSYLGVSWVTLPVKDAALFLLYMTTEVKYVLCWYSPGGMKVYPNSHFRTVSTNHEDW